MVKSSGYDLDLIFQALADPTRRAILSRLKKREIGITEIAEPFDMSLVAVAKHVKVLERAKLIERRRHGSFSYLRLNGKAMLSADEWLEHYRIFWEQSLDRLENYLKQVQTGESKNSS